MVFWTILIPWILDSIDMIVSSWTIKEIRAICSQSEKNAPFFVYFWRMLDGACLYPKVEILTLCKNFPLFMSNINTLKVNKHEESFDFFCLNQNLIRPWSKFWKNSESFISIFSRISMLEHFRGDWAYAEPIFCWEVSKDFFVKCSHWSYEKGSLTFFKILIIYTQK